MKLLTIAIPTFNRANCLERLLVSILPVCEGMDIEVLVSDNCSQDNTPQVAQKYAHYKCLRYLRSSENKGFDRNILNLLDNARGHFVWLMGDDDNIEVSRLSALIKLLEANKEKALFFVSYRSENDRVRPAGTELKWLDLNPQAYVDRFLHRATLISTDIINLDYYRKLKIDPAVISKGWIHLHLLLLLVDQQKLHNEKVLAVKDRLVIQGSEDNIYPLEKWVRVFIHSFSFTIERTSLKTLRLKWFLKKFYDINIRPRFLTTKDLIRIDDLLANYRLMIRTFSPPITGRWSFWLQYLLIRLPLDVIKRFSRSESRQNSN
jgi:glycosyltransferase involved in cell wall biosynthesis